MAEQIHGHEVMEMMIESGQTYTKESLKSEIISKFGEDARFFTCSAENMSAQEIIDFLETKGKFVSQEDGFKTDVDNICNH